MKKQNAREQGRIILAHGESTGHCHEVVTVGSGLPPGMEGAQFFDESDGTRTLIVLEPCVLRHDEHALIALDPTRVFAPGEVLRQGDVCLRPTGPGTFTVIRQREWSGPDEWRTVAD